MSLGPRNKKPDGLIDGCFGPSAYCERCKYEKDFGDMHEMYCKSCREIVARQPANTIKTMTVEDLMEAYNKNNEN